MRAVTWERITTEQLRWLHGAATEIAVAQMNMTMSPDEVLLITNELLAIREAVPVYQMRLLDGSPDQYIWVEVTHEEFNTPLKNLDEWEKRILYITSSALAAPNGGDCHHETR